MIRWIIVPGFAVLMLWYGGRYFLADKQTIGAYENDECLFYFRRIEEMCRDEKVDATRWLKLLEEQGIEPAREVRVVSLDDHTAAGKKISERGMIVRQILALRREGYAQSDIAQKLSLAPGDVDFVFRAATTCGLQPANQSQP